MSNPSLFHALALIASISLMAAPTLANLHDDAAAPTLANFPDGALWWWGGGVQGSCFEGIRGVQGCIQELTSSFLRLQPQILGSACCKALLDIDDTCLPKMFPFHLDFLNGLKSTCAGGEDTPTTPDLSPPPPPPPCCVDVPPPPPPLPCSSDDDDGEDCDYDYDYDD